MEHARVGLLDEARRLGGDAVISGRLAFARDVPDGSTDSAPGSLSNYCRTEAWENGDEGHQPGWWLWEAHIIRFTRPRSTDGDSIMLVGFP